MIELADGIFIAPEHVAMVKEVEKDTCLLFFVGQSALEGHVLPYAASEVVEAIDDALYESGDDYEDIEETDDQSTTSD